ncbi:AAA family ATPase [Marinilactibacillus sp. XAAS-LB27]|uniref:guanylate kinase n=1 Tax=Marinilactibacillus sp. XAAS-LB27 TaxID=3114538 RepID=UPI002E1990E1|nr:AAA family ATPase [Marinilactibacillus sp. XAAS-LB27]
MGNKCIIVMVGPSGSGKTTVGESLSRNGIPKLVTTTTREPRLGEQEGIDYHFRKVEELDPSDFIEQTVYNNKVYGLTKQEVSDALREHDVVHVSLDRHGAKAMKRSFPRETVVVFIYISKEMMAERMRKRGDSEEKIYERLCHSEANDELAPPEDTDLIIENISIQETVDQILSHLTQTN